MADGGKPPGMRWLNAISWLAPACFLHRALLLLNHTWKPKKRAFIYLPTEWNKLNCSAHSVYGHLYFRECVCVCLWILCAVCARPPITRSWTDRDLNIWRVQWNHRHYIFVCYCKSPSSQANARGLSQLVKPILAHYLNQASILGGIFTHGQVWQKTTICLRTQWAQCISVHLVEGEGGVRHEEGHMSNV